MSGAHPCTWCKFPKTLSEYCSCACKDLGEAYQRGRDEERAAVVADLRSWCHKETDFGNRYANRIEKGEHEVKR